MTFLFKNLKEQLKYDYECLNSNLKHSYYEAFLSSFVIGIAESFFAAFSIDKGMSTIQSGLLLSLPLIFAVGFNLVLHFYIKQRPVVKQVKFNTLLQVLSLVCLVAFSFTHIENMTTLFFSLILIYSIYWYGFFSSQPSWNSWISEILEDHNGSDYFALRTRIYQVGIIIGLISGGALLKLKLNQLSTDYLFGFLFFVATLAQILKYYTFKKHKQIEFSNTFSFYKIKNILRTNKSFFSSYGLFNASLFLSAPYVTGYLLNSRKIDYFHFMIITASLFVGKIATTFILNLNDKDYSPIKMMALGGLIAAPLPFAWPFCQSVESMYLLNFTSGMAWALWEIGLSLTFFKKISQQDKIETVTLYNTIGIITQVFGTCLGAFLIKYLFNYNLTYVFMTSGIIRFLCILPFQKNENLNPSALIENQRIDYKKVG